MGNPVVMQTGMRLAQNRYGKSHCPAIADNIWSWLGMKALSMSESQTFAWRA